MNRRGAVATVVVMTMAALAQAHHGGVSLSMGPGSPIEANSPLTLPQGGFVVSARSEQVSWKKFGFSEPENIDSYSFYNLGISYGIAPYLTGTVFVPYTVKRQDTMGSAKGGGDVKLMFNSGFNRRPGQGFRLNTPDETAVSLDASEKVFASVYAGVSFPTGKDDIKLGGEVDGGMQPGFGSHAFTGGLSLARNMFGAFTLVGDAGFDIYEKSNQAQFGTELRLNLAGIRELYGRDDAFVSKVDGILELNYLALGRDEDHGVKERATGGEILYLSPGFRLAIPKWWSANLGLMVKTPVWKNLNEDDDQQGGEGLEKFRLISTLSFFF